MAVTEWGQWEGGEENWNRMEEGSHHMTMASRHFARPYEASSRRLFDHMREPFKLVVVTPSSHPRDAAEFMSNQQEGTRKQHI